MTRLARADDDALQRAPAPAALDTARERLAAAEKASERLASATALYERFRRACD